MLRLLHRRLSRILFASLLLGCIAATVADEPTSQSVLDFTPDFPVDAIDARDANASLETDSEGRTWLRLELGDSVQWPGITIFPQGETGWDFSKHARVLFDVKNVGEFGTSINLRIDTTSNDGREQTVQGFVEAGVFDADANIDGQADINGRSTSNGRIGVQETSTISAPIRRRLPESYEGKLFGMRGLPGDYWESSGLLEPDRVTKIWIFVASPDRPHSLLIDNIRLEGAAPLATLPPEFDESFFPMIDQFGQYAHADWPGKTHSVEDLRRMAEEEEADLAANPRPENFNQYGGWADGPKFEATGRFHVKKHEGSWWFVDPEGCLFWSHGVDCVGPNSVTPISDRRHYYESLPEPGSEFAQFYGRGSWAPHGYYEGFGPYETYNFGAANLMMKHGEGWREQDAQNAHRRLPRWGMNTIANWSDWPIFLRSKTPYVVSIGYSSPKIEGSEGYWGKFPDPFHPEFESAVQRAMEGQKTRTVDDPFFDTDAAVNGRADINRRTTSKGSHRLQYCLGYFVDNELGWGDETSLAKGALASPPEQPAKIAVLESLRSKYDTIETLNDAWDTEYDSWDAVSENKTPPSVEAGEESPLYQDLVELYSLIAEQYFRVVSDAVHEAAPEGLYLGCRFSNDNETAVRAAEKYVDVISFNRYRPSVADLTLPESIDMPVIIGEFHFGALDRGMLHTGLQPVEDQDARAAAYESYVRGALQNPSIVGTHWFQYRSQATTGRGDGENYQIGFVDMCDSPYPEIVEASRRVGADMYELRSGAH
jgi:hypothetical protein